MRLNAQGLFRRQRAVEVPGQRLLGLGVRSVWSELDFGGDASDFDLGGVQVFLTYSIGSAPFFASPHW